MESAIAARIQAWDTRPLTGGYAGLQELAAESFSGAVTTGPAWVFLLNGRIVGVVDGALASFEGADLTAFEAPDATLPLLFAMQEQGGETQAKYYTDDNPLPEVHQTLSEAGFTGYLELSDNVLSGDYYVVYYGGKSMSAAFVGNAEKLLTGDEAFHRAADEVGIYEVVDVDLDVRDVPEPAEEPDAAAGAAGTAAGTGAPAGASAGAGAADGAAAGATDGADRQTDEDPAPAAVDATTDEPAGAGGVEATGGESGDAGGGAAEGAPATGGRESEEPPAAAEPSPAEEPDRPPTDDESTTAPGAPASTSDAPTPHAGTSDADTAATDPDEAPVGDPAEEPPDATASEEAAERPPSAGSPAPDDPFTEEAAWREARTIPALDPDETDAPAAAEDGGQQTASGGPRESSEPAAPDPEPSAEDDRIAELEAAIERQAETIAALESRLETSSAEAEALREEREDLEARLASTREAGAAEVAPASRTLDEETALDQTDLFVRYGTKGGGTLEKAHDGVIDREEVVENLRIDHHTRFEEDEVEVAGRAFRDWLHGTLEYRFVDWLVTECLFEILDTGSQRGLRDLFDVIPLVDRVEFSGTVVWRDPEAGETYEEDFDVICRDRMGQALVVANLNDDRDPATGEMMTRLIEGASSIAAGVESLSGAFLVTSSFFQPDALETASEATSGGLLSREKRWSYVKPGRRNGYHLCLVEARGDDFHVAVPEL